MYNLNYGPVVEAGASRSMLDAPAPRLLSAMGWTVAVSHHLEVATDPRFRYSQRTRQQYNAMRERRNVFACDFHIPGEIHNSGPPSMPGL